MSALLICYYSIAPYICREGISAVVFIVTGKLSLWLYS